MTAEQQPSRYRCENWEIRKTKGDCPVFHIYLNNKYFAQTIDEYKADLIIGAFNIASHSDFQQPAKRGGRRHICKTLTREGNCDCIESLYYTKHCEYADKRKHQKSCPRFTEKVL